MKFTEALAIMVGTEIGGGVLSMPYAAAMVGVVPAMLIIAASSIIMLFTSLLVLKFTHEMNGAHFSAMTRAYLGKAGGWIMYLSIFTLVFGALLAYIDGMGDVFAELFGISGVAGALIFWVFVSLIVYLGIEASGKTEWVLTLSMMLLLVGMAVMLVPYGKPDNFEVGTLTVDNTVTMFGVALFALLSQIVIPHVYNGLGSYQSARRVIILAYVIPTSIYVLIAVMFIFAFGPDTPQIATEGLRRLYGSAGNVVGNLVPFLALTTSYLGNAIANQGNSEEFLHLKKLHAWALTNIPPLAVYLLGMRNFADAVAFAGNSGALLAFVAIPLAILVVRRRRRAKSL